MRKAWRLMLCGCSLVVGLSGCLKNEKEELQQFSGISIHHSSPDAPPMNITIDNKVINSQAFRYQNYTGYIQFPEGNHHIGVNRFDNNSSLLDSTFSFKLYRPYSLYIINTLANIELWMIEDISDLPASGNGKIRCLNLSPDTPKVDVRLTGESSSLFSGLTFKQASDFKDLPVNTYSLDIKMIGGNGRTVTLSNIEIKEGEFYSILVEGFDNLPAGNTNIFSARVISQ